MPPPAGQGLAGRLRSSVGWNLSLNAASKTQSLALLVAGAIAGGLSDVGIATTAMGAVFLGGALADFGLSAEIGRLSVTHPTRAAIRRSVSALAWQTPLALVFAPLIFYVTIGHRAGAPAELLVAIAALASLYMASTGLAAVLNGLHDFRSPATRLGSTRFVASIVAVAATAVVPSPATIIGTFAVGEAAGMVGVALAVRRARAGLPDEDEHSAHVRRSHLWIGGAVMFNVLTNQSDTLLVAPVLSPSAVGIYGIASLLANGVATLSLATSQPFTFRVIATTIAGDSRAAQYLLRRGLTVAGAAAAVGAALTWGFTQGLGHLVDSLAKLANGTAPLVLGLYLPSAVPNVLGAAQLNVGIGYARHRAVGLARIKAGLLAAVCIPLGAYLGGVVAAAAMTLLRDSTLLALARGVIAHPPDGGELRPPEPAQAMTLEAEAVET